MIDDHIMIDIETLGLNQDAAIVQIGAVRFYMYPQQFRIIGRFNRKISIASNLIHNRRIEQDTIDWWKETSVDLFEKVTSGEENLHCVLYDLSAFVKDAATVWCNGTDFDIMILRHAYRTSTLTVPWTRRQLHDCRTIFNLFKNVYSADQAADRHDALADANFQAEKLSKIIQTIKGALDGDGDTI